MLATEILEIRFSEMLAITISRNVGNYTFPKYWQLYFPEMLAIEFVGIAGDKCYLFIYLFENGGEC